MSNSYNLSIAPELAEIKGPTFNAGTDSLEHIRDEQTLIEGAGFVSANHSIKKVWDDTEGMNNLISYLSRTGANLNVQVQNAGVLNDIDAAGVTSSAISALETIFPGTPTANTPMEVLKNIYSKTLPDSRVYSETDDLLFSNDAEKADNQASYTIEKIILCGVNGILRIKFDLKYTGGAGTVFGKIFKNGVDFGTERTNSSATYVTYSEDLAFVANDKIELWGKNGTTSFSFQNFRVYGVMYNLFLNTLT